MKLKLIPIADRAIVDYKEVVQKNEVEGILLPDGFTPGGKTETLYVEAKIVAIGPDVKWLKVGQKVIVAKPRIERIVFDGHTYWQIVEAAVSAILG